jgi:dTDP-4-amino-4,6-dideoxygalactose transaminase
MTLKSKIEDLAILGGTPSFPKPLHVGSPNIGNRKKFLERVNHILDERWLTNDGPYVKEFEARIASIIGVKHCVVVDNGTRALEILIRALELKGDVIVPAFTFVASAHALEWQGITPVFCDVDPKTYTLDPRQVLQRITPHTTGIIGVHLWGQVCDTESLAQIAKERGLKLIFDAAHAFGCSWRKKMVGHFGEAEIFSFHATKSINSLEGGAIVTNNDALAEKMRLMRNFGFAGYDRVVYVGTNAKMNEMAAAMGITNLESMDEFFQVNRRNYRTYERALAGVAGIHLMSYDEKERCNFQYVVIEMDDAKSHISRDQVMDLLWAENVRARRYFYPGCHRMEPYRSRSTNIAHLLPVTERAVQRALVLPTGTAVGEKEIEKICDLIRFAVSQAGRLVPALEKEKKHQSVSH